MMTVVDRPETLLFNTKITKKVLKYISIASQRSNVDHIMCVNLTNKGATKGHKYK